MKEKSVSGQQINLKKENTIYYKDFDFFRAEGKIRLDINNLDYPYVELSYQENDTVDMIIHLEKEKSFEQKLYKENNLWKSYYKDYDMDSGWYRHYFFSYEIDRVVKFVYATNQEKKPCLIEVSITTSEKNEQYIFSFFDGIELDQHRLSMIPLNKRVSTIESLYFYDKSILRILSSIFNHQQNKILLETESCYNIEHSSFFWFQIMGDTYRLESCD